MSLTIGLYLSAGSATAGPRGCARIAALAEDLGYDSLWAPDHVVLPDPRVEPSPLDPHIPLLDPVVLLTFLAARTERILLATGCVVLPQRNPLVLAQQLAAVDVLSGGRLVFGAASGYLEPELRALGVPPAERGTRMEEYLRAIRSLWEDDRPAFHGRHVDFRDVNAYPRPVARPVPVVLGGNSRIAHRRAAALADGWYGWMLGLRATAEQVASVREHAAAAGRPLHISVTPARRLDPGIVQSYAGLGVDRLIVAAEAGLPLDELERFVERNAPDRLLT
ncbi:LLM class F420-dependent oxidoreductase [Nonomuraea sp. ZG12]|jgi:probable F420-dependent oxidoreductase|uniref:LLM class F420-dependent oxidoreductase n=1 Tax=Nonomuraea sp. ZG12 TaxID=3452207 RepID=UPI003F8CE30F